MYANSETIVAPLAGSQSRTSARHCRDIRDGRSRSRNRASGKHDRVLYGKTFTAPIMTAQPTASAHISGASGALSNAADPRLQALGEWLASVAEPFSLDLAQWAPASADASFRRYFRIGSHDPAHPSLIVMDAPPPQEDCRPRPPGSTCARYFSPEIPPLHETHRLPRHSLFAADEESPGTAACRAIDPILSDIW